MFDSTLTVCDAVMYVIPLHSEDVILEKSDTLVIRNTPPHQSTVMLL
jgi:hypothetical protein